MCAKILTLPDATWLLTSPSGTPAKVYVVLSQDRKSVYLLESKKRRPSNEPSQTAYDIFALIQFGRSTHRHKLLRKTLILFTPIKKANAKKVAPAKRGKILVLPGHCRTIMHCRKSSQFPMK